MRVISHANHAVQIAAAGAEYRPYRYAPQLDSNARHDHEQENWMVRVLQEMFLNPTFGDELLAEVSRDAPDVILVDQMLLMAASAAEYTDLPTGILWHTLYGAILSSPLRLMGPMLDGMNALREKMGLVRVTDAQEVIERADAIVAFTYPAFDTVPPDLPGHLHYVGPLACVPQPLPAYSLPWPPEDVRPLILVSYSTSFQDQVPTLQRVADAVAGLPVRALFTLGSAIAADELQLPDNVVAETFVPHAAVLPHTNLVVTHAGHGTVMAAITAGVPLVCTPMGRDQDIVSECVERRGLGRVSSMTASSEELRRTIAAVLQDDALRQRARTFAAGVDVGAGLRRAVEVLENLRTRDGQQ